jgi:hypothetical protein
MSQFGSLFSSIAFPVLCAQAGQEITYNPPTGEPVPITAIFAELPAAPFDREGHREKAPRKAVAECPVTVGGSPQTYDVDGTFTVGSDLWRVDGFGDRNDALITIHLRIAGDIQFTGVK